MSTFTPTHIFVLDDGTEVPVIVTLLGDYVAVDADNNRWCTNMGAFAPHWACPMRNIRSIQRVKMPKGVLHPDVRLLVDMTFGVTAKYKVAPHDMCPLDGSCPPMPYRWVIRFPRPTTSTEKDILKAHGFKFTGGAWNRPDD